MIIVSLTSWRKRINNVSTIISNMLSQTIKADLIELNLCSEEFQQKENNLPVELNNLLGDKFVINWVEQNTYTFKKFIPTLQKHFGKNYYLITIDDDKLYDNDYIEFLINHIGSNDTFCASGVGNLLIGGLMIYKSLIFEKDFWEKLTPEIIETKVDDTYIQYYLKYKGAKFGKNIDNKQHWKLFNECFPTRDFYLKENRIKKCNELSKQIFKLNNI